VEQRRGRHRLFELTHFKRVCEFNRNSQRQIELRFAQLRRPLRAVWRRSELGLQMWQRPGDSAKVTNDVGCGKHRRGPVRAETGTGAASVHG